jgi:hypothetical protein
MGETIAEFMERQRRRVTRFGQEAEAAAHEAYGRAIRTGQDLNLRSPGEVMRYGAKLLQDGENHAAGAVSNAARQAKRQANNTIERIGETPGLRSVAVGAAGSAGTLAGVVRGGVHAAEGLAKGATFIGRLANPLDRVLSAPGQSAGDKLREAGNQAADYIGKAAKNPQLLVDDVKAKAHQMHVDLDPGATPAAPTFAGELKRNFDIGQNVGELAFDAGSLVVGGPAAKAVKGFERVSNVGNVDRYLAQGFTPKAAAHLAEPYPASNMGSHFIPRRARLPEALGGGPIPREYMDGPFNRLAPPGISRGDLYELHYGVDGRFHGTDVLGERWSGRDLGLPRYGPVGQLWHGSPAPLKARVGGLGAGAGDAVYNLEGRNEGW